MSWTIEQRAAMESRGQNLLLSAAAGSGKTAVLVERIIGRLMDEDDPIDVHQLLVMTFTRAAAGEMRSRIGAALAAVAEETGSKRAQRQLALLGSASIMTIHSFCASLIKQYFYRLDLDPGYSQGSDQEMALIRTQAMDQVMDEFYESGDPDFLALADMFRKRYSDGPLRETVSKMAMVARSLPFPEAWLEGLAAPYEVGGFRADRDLKLLDERWLREMKYWYANLLDFHNQLLPCQKAEKYTNTLNADLTFIYALGSSTHWQERYHLLQAMETRLFRWPTNKLPNEFLEIKNHAKSMRDDMKKSLDKWRLGELAVDPSRWSEEMESAHANVVMLVRLVRSFLAHFNALKRAKRRIDFTDLEHMALALLLDPSSTADQPVPSDTAREVAARYREVMVDEYQDTNGVQELIASLVSGPDNRFMVGDVKQSIYRFRMADPGIFLGKYVSFLQTESAQDRRIDLQKNFRSDWRVLETTNTVFRQVMKQPHAEFDYGDAEALVAGRVVDDPPDSWVGGKTMVRIMIPTEEETAKLKKEQLEYPSAIQAQAEAVAKEILALKAEQRTVQRKDGSFEPIEWRDIAILMRSVKSTSPVVVDVFRRYGIPVFAEQTEGYFNAIEVQVMLALLALLDNSRRDLEAATVLKSPIVGLNERDLARLALLQRERDGQSLMQCLADFDGAASERIQVFLNHFQIWRKMAREESVSALAHQIYRDSGYRALLSGLADGAVRKANLDALVRRAREFDEALGTGLVGFLRFFDELRRGGGDFGVPSVIGEGEDVVRVMSIHKSKGLEFPVVFVLSLQSPINERDLQEKVLFHRVAGIGMPVYDSQRDSLSPSAWWFGLKARILHELRSEEQRLLYVAMTRARDKLYLYAHVQLSDKLVYRWQRDRDGAMANSYLGWVMGALPAAEDYTGGGTHPWVIEHLVVEPVPMEVVAESVPMDACLEAVQRGEMTGVAISDDDSQRLLWSYPHALATALPAKVTVTKLVKDRSDAVYPERLEGALAAVYEAADAMDEDVSVPVVNLSQLPQFMADTSQSEGAMAYGSLMHRLMEKIDWLAIQTETDISATLDHGVAAGWLGEEERKIVNEKSLMDFARSKIGQALANAPLSWREVPFSILLPANLVFTGADESERIYLQGVIDALYEEAEGHLVVLDYKTDRVDDVDVLYERYQSQLEWYAYAVERLWQRKVSKRVLYSLHLGAAKEW